MKKVIPQFANKPTPSQASHRLVNSRTSEFAKMFERKFIASLSVISSILHHLFTVSIRQG